MSAELEGWDWALCLIALELRDPCLLVVHFLMLSLSF